MWWLLDPGDGCDEQSLLWDCRLHEEKTVLEGEVKRLAKTASETQTRMIATATTNGDAGLVEELRREIREKDETITRLEVGLGSFIVIIIQNHYLEIRALGVVAS